MPRVTTGNTTASCIVIAQAAASPEDRKLLAPDKQRSGGQRSSCPPRPHWITVPLETRLYSGFQASDRAGAPTVTASPARWSRGSFPTLSMVGACRRSSCPLSGRHGWNVTGVWPFASGCQSAEWMVGTCVMMEGGSPIDASDGPGPMIRSCIMPAEHWEIRDTWHTSGLKCTGSHDVALTDVLVPDENFFGFPFGISFGGRRAASQRQPRVVRRKLRPGQPASHQRPVRLPSLARAGTWRSRPTSHRPRSGRAISGRPIRSNCSANAATTATPDAPHPRDRDPRRGEARRLSCWDPVFRTASVCQPRPLETGSLTKPGSVT